MQESNIAARILIVDDSAFNIQVLGSMLRQQNYRIYIAQNGKQALHVARETIPDLILLDISMPEMDGLETCRQLQQFPETSDIPVIFITARSEEQDIVEGFEAGAVDYVTKPFNAAILRARVKTHVTLRQKTKLLQDLANRDGMTWLANRRHFDEVLERDWLNACHAGKPLALALLDIDFFKNYNDTYGHLQGDVILKQVASILDRAAEEVGGLAARYGGEEFAVILPETLVDTAAQFAETVRERIDALNIPHAGSKIYGKVTVSLGVAAIVPEQEGIQKSLIEAADNQLYRAKETGRNRVMHE